MKKISELFLKRIVVLAVVLAVAAAAASWPTVTSAQKHFAKKGKITQARHAHGKLVCRSSHSNPSVSKKGKGHHVDEDCCPDPDEWPNKSCTYSGSDYGIMLQH